MSGIKIESSVIEKNFEKKKEPEDKLKSSCFFITVNSNKMLGAPDFEEEQAARFRSALEMIFSSERIAKYLLDTKHDGDLSPEYVKSINVQLAFEVGSKFGRTHAHVLVSVKHTSNIRFKLPLLRSTMNHIVGSKVHINLKAFSSQVATLEEYLRK
jgi:hypothetical protein